MFHVKTSPSPFPTLMEEFCFIRNSLPVSIILHYLPFGKPGIWYANNMQVRPQVCIRDKGIDGGFKLVHAPCDIVITSLLNTEQMWTGETRPNMNDILSERSPVFRQGPSCAWYVSTSEKWLVTTLWWSPLHPLIPELLFVSLHRIKTWYSFSSDADYKHGVLFHCSL